MNNAFAVSVIIPACNEERHIQGCLQSILAQVDLSGADLQVVVSANGCTDKTVEIAQGFAPLFAVRGWDFSVIETPVGSKVGALNMADARARFPARAYVDADIRLDIDLLRKVLDSLEPAEPRYVTGRMKLARSRSWVSRFYGALWLQLPFMRPGTAPGAGFFAVNPAGRARWGAFPDVVADDGYVRWHFAPEERFEVDAGFQWPLVEGFAALVRVRRRQDLGGKQLKILYPELVRNEGKPGVSLSEHFRLALSMPLSYVIYVAVQIMVRLGSSDDKGWVRGPR
ncbi:MAG: glycosyl transferase [Planctomycetota bacterium]|nr:MAG: glycosyl transferase [Planctomycetota bacterium]